MSRALLSHPVISLDLGRRGAGTGSGCSVDQATVERALFFLGGRVGMYFMLCCWSNRFFYTIWFSCLNFMFWYSCCIWNRVVNIINKHTIIYLFVDMHCFFCECLLCLSIRVFSFIPSFCLRNACKVFTFLWEIYCVSFRNLHNMTFSKVLKTFQKGCQVTSSWILHLYTFLYLCMFIYVCVFMHVYKKKCVDVFLCLWKP